MKKLWAMIVLTALFLAGCSAEKSVGWTVTSDGENSYTLERALPEHGDSGFIKVLYGQKGFFCRMADGSELYYIADLQTGELKKVGEAKNHSLTGRNYAMIGDTMYFYVTVRGSERPKNVLYAVDFSKEKMDTVCENTYNMKLIPLISLDGELYALQGDLVGGKTMTFVERIKPSGKSERVEFDRGENAEERRVLFMESDGEFVYTYEESADTGYISKYDSGFSLVSELDITNVVLQYPFGGVGAVRVFENYFYLADLGGASRLCRYDENGAEVIMFDYALEHVLNSGETEHEYFYIRRTNELYRLDPKNCTFERVAVPDEGEDSVIRYMISNNGTLLMAKCSSDVEADTWERIYYYPCQRVTH